MNRLLLSTMIALTACGGDSSGPSEPAFPAVAGTYTINGRFDGLSTSEASFSGTLTLNQISRDVGDLTGVLRIQLRVGGDVAAAEGPLELASIAPSGDVTFKTEGNTGSWTFTGNIDNNGVVNSGRHTINSEEIGVISGSWIGARNN